MNLSLAPFESPREAACFWQAMAERAHADAVAAINVCAFRTACDHQRDAAHFAKGARDCLFEVIGVEG